MRTCLLVALGVLLASSVAFAQYMGDPETNDTQWATCERYDPYDEFIYHAPQIENITVDGNADDWDAYPLLEWTRIGNYCEGTGQNLNLTTTGFQSIPTEPVEEDFFGQFKAGWGMNGDWPVLYLLVEWHDNYFDFNPGAAWDQTDLLQFWYSEVMYDDNVEYLGNVLSGIDGDLSCRQMNVYIVPGWGIRLYKSFGEECDPYCPDPTQEYSVGEFQYISDDAVLLECSVQMFQDYNGHLPWVVTPGESCLAFGIAGCCDYDADGSFTYWTWGLSNRKADGWGREADVRVCMSTIGFEDTYNMLFYGTPTAVQSATWGAIKNTF